MTTIYNENDPVWKDFFRRMNTRQDDVLERKMAPILRKKLKPLISKLERTTKMPPGLTKQEAKYRERAEWPRSIYIPEVLWDLCKAFESIPDSQPLKLEYLDTYEHPWMRSSSFVFDESLDRNKHSLTKSAGPPRFGKKRDELAAAKQYVSEVLKPDPKLENSYCIAPGTRTQQSSPEDPKIRLVWMIPITTWIIESEAVDDAITKTIEATASKPHQIFVFYTQLSGLKEWFAKFEGEVMQWVNLDATVYDSTVTAVELDQLVEYFVGDFEFSEFIAQYLKQAELALPHGLMSRYGGMPSGSKFTNLGDGWTNVLDIIESFARFKLDRFIVCIAVNGDDITVGLSTKLSEDNLKKISTVSRRNINYTKSELGTYVWNSKLVVEVDQSGEVLITRPAWRVYNSLCFTERVRGPIFASKEYIELATASILQDIEEHPYGDQIIDLVASVTKFHLSTMSNDQLQDAANAYLGDNVWREERDTNELIDSLRSTRYGQAKV